MLEGKWKLLKGTEMDSSKPRFITPRPSWATTSDSASEMVCLHIREFATSGPVRLWIQQKDELTENGLQIGRPAAFIGVAGEMEEVTINDLISLAGACTAVVETLSAED